MKTLLILSAILLFPFLLLSISVGAVLIINPTFLGKDINTPVLLIYLLILCLSVSVITMTTISMIKYTPKIKKLDEAEADVRKEQSRLSGLIEKYNELISLQNLESVQK